METLSGSQKRSKTFVEHPFYHSLPSSSPNLSQTRFIALNFPPSSRQTILKRIKKWLWKFKVLRIRYDGFMWHSLEPILMEWFRYWLGRKKKCPSLSIVVQFSFCQPDWFANIPCFIFFFVSFLQLWLFGGDFSFND